MNGAGKQSTGKSDSDINNILGLNLKGNLEKSSNEKSSVAAFTRRGVASQEFIDKVKAVLEKAALNKQNDTISIKVDPPHLGEVTIKVSQKNGEIHAKLSAENKEIEAILKSQSSELNGILQSLGFKSNEVHVQIGSTEMSADFSSLKDLNYDKDQSNFQEKNLKTANSGRSDISDLVGNGVIETKNMVQESGWVA
jgi:flagellar hook-length control protein FliK